MRELYLDTETYCETPIKDGTFRYAEDAEVMILAYAYDEEPVHVVDLTAGQEIPQQVVCDMTDPGVLKVFHNSMFDRTVLRMALGIDIPAGQIYDTMVQALTHSLPGGLAKLCDILGIGETESKDASGKALIHLFCKPRPSNSLIRRYTRETHPQQWHSFLVYAGSDIGAMRAIRRKMPRWNYRDRELELWRLDQRINDRGFAVDRELARSAIAAVTKTQQGFIERVQDDTFGCVGSALQRDRLLEFILKYYGVELPDMRKATLERRLEDPNLPREVRELIAIRLEASMSSTSKYKALLKAVNDDGRMRGGLQFSGAGRTLRWAGRTFQPQNLFRPTMKQDKIEEGITWLKSGQAEKDSPKTMEIAANAVRGCIIAEPGRKLCISDLSNIEGRYAAWAAGEEWKLQAFRDFDNGIGHDLYKLAYAKAFNVDPTSVTKDQRQIGKVKELMLGYGGGVGAYITGATTYRIDLEEMARMALPNIPEDVKQEAFDFWQYNTVFLPANGKTGNTFGLSREAFIACDALKRLWRRTNPAISSIWEELEDAYRAATRNPGHNFKVRKFVFRRDGMWLRVGLPNGFVMCYANPAVDEKGVISYYGVSTYSRKWSKITTYGGKLLENLVQRGARDIMAHNMPIIHNSGYPIVLTVHDELITEPLDLDEYSAEGLSELLATTPPWAEGLPLAAGGFESYRYKKGD